MFFLSDKTEYHKVDNYVIEPRVYVTNHGDCYHAYSCHYLSQSMIAKGIREQAPFSIALFSFVLFY